MGTVEIPLTQGLIAIVDECDLAKASQYSWHAARVANGKIYAATNITVAPGKRRVMYLHRHLLDAPKGLDVDHVDNNGLNNTRRNIRIATRGQNLANRGKEPDRTSRFLGVHWRRKDRVWIASISIDGTYRYLGSFRDEEEAAATFDDVARETRGEFARLNFPLSGERAA